MISTDLVLADRGVIANILRSSGLLEIKTPLRSLPKAIEVISRDMLPLSRKRSQRLKTRSRVPIEIFAKHNCC